MGAFRLSGRRMDRIQVHWLRPGWAGLTSRRPLIRVELIVPSSRWYTRTSTEAGASLEDYVPLYTKDIGKDESQVSPAAPGAPTT